LGDFGDFYDVELPYIYKCLNALRKNQVSPAGESVEPAPTMWKVEDNKIYMRNSDNTDWVMLMDLVNRGGVLQLGEAILVTSGILNEGETVLKNTDLEDGVTKAGRIAVYNNEGYITGTLRTVDIPASDATAEQKVGKVVAYDSAGNVPGAVMRTDLATDSVKSGKVAVYNEDGVLPANIAGSAASVGGKRVNAAGLEDGQVLAFDEATNTWIPSDRFAGVGQGKTLALMDYKGPIGSYNGGAMTQLDMPVGTLLPSVSYAKGEIALTNQLPTGMALVCVSAGATPSEIPSLTEVEP
jgi:hypothetical protein